MPRSAPQPRRCSSPTTSRPRAACWPPPKAGGVGHIVHAELVGAELGGARLLRRDEAASRRRLSSNSAIPACILGPTLMYGWFDRKHLGWLAPLLALHAGFRRARPRRVTCASRSMLGDFCDLIARLPRDSPSRTGLQHLRPGTDRLHRLDPRDPAATAARTAILRIPMVSSGPC